MKIRRISVFPLIIIMLFGIFGGLFKAFAAETPILNENMKTVTFTEDKGVYADTARGFYRMSTSGRMTYDTLIDRRENEKVTLVLLSMELEDFKTGPISDAALADLESSFSTIRFAGGMAVFRASYDRVGAEEAEPHDINIILEHIRQICAVLSRNSDIIYSVQAGMLGCYGEWHGSYYEDPVTGRIDYQTQKKVVNEFLANLPTEMSVAVRRPIFIRNITNNGMVSSSTAFSSAQAARVAFHNDALLSTVNDMNTYCDKTYTREQELDWGNQLNRYLPFVGEANRLSDYCEPSTAVQILDLLNTQSINGTYSPNVMDHWHSTNYRDEVAYTYIQKKLGYRFIINSAALNTNTWSGNFLHLNLKFINDGFGNLLRPTDFDIVLTGGGKTYTAKINDDPRRWDDDAGAINKDFYFSLPSDMPAGSYLVALKLSSTYSSIKNDPRYNIRFASEGVWDEKTGLNTLGKITIGTPENPGTKVSSFKQISKSEASALNSSSPDYEETVTADESLDTEEEDNTDNDKDITITDDAKYLYIDLKNVDSSVKRQIFINTDGNTANGYEAAKGEFGYEWMIEGKYLYRFTGEDGTDDWSWTQNKSIMSHIATDEAQFILELSVLGLKPPASVTVLYQREDGISADIKAEYTSGITVTETVEETVEEEPEDAPPDEPEPVEPEPVEPETPGPEPVEPETEVAPVIPVSYNLYVSGKNLVISQENVDTSGKHQVFIDSDGNSSTGFALSKSRNLTGYDYLVENSRIYKFIGTDNTDGWDWYRFDVSNLITYGNTITHSIPLSTLGVVSKGVIHTVYRRDDDKTTEIRRDCIIDAATFPEAEIKLPEPELVIVEPEPVPVEPEPSLTPPETEATTTTTTTPETTTTITTPTTTTTSETEATTTTTTPPETEATTTTTTPKPGNNGNGNGNGNGNNGNGKPKK